jgi:hypothetical protein
MAMEVMHNAALIEPDLFTGLIDVPIRRTVAAAGSDGSRNRFTKVFR